MMQLKKLNIVLFLVRYNDKYYADTISSGEFTKLGSPYVFYGSILSFLLIGKKKLVALGLMNCYLITMTYHICVGAIACRLEKKEGGTMRVYIMTLGVLAPYRGIGIGSKLLNHVLDMCSKQKNMCEIYFHVQTNNEDAIVMLSSSTLLNLKPRNNNNTLTWGSHSSAGFVCSVQVYYLRCNASVSRV
ncbi:unnamed protein product [Eruca vesicaria subsp. sativa]|uniref:N-acetyltransferase domain-containing protein n=1 Tax=Eruca vesicaria subsp. sativa TaxID=29727 RepID=A0ABC8JJG0_ERUVS|nr:unnamed protein product [Eruca vesicaria subsp. sativa]